MDEELRRFKSKKSRQGIKQSVINKKEEQFNLSNFIVKMVCKLIIVTTITLVTILILNNDEKLKTNFYKHVFDTNFSFVTLNELYENKFGSAIPFNELVKEPTITVFNEEIKYQETSKYLDGVKLTVEKNYLIPIMTSGMVVYIGEKEGYGNTVIIQGMDSVDTWYGNVENVNVELYEYVKEGDLLGEVVNEELYMVFKKEGNVLNYEEYIK